MSRFNFKSKRKLVDDLTEKYGCPECEAYRVRQWNKVISEKDEPKMLFKDYVRQRNAEYEEKHKEWLKLGKPKNKRPIKPHFWQLCRVHRRCIEFQHLAHFEPRTKKDIEAEEEQDAEFYASLPPEIDDSFIDERTQGNPDYPGLIDYEELNQV